MVEVAAIMIMMMSVMAHDDDGDGDGGVHSVACSVFVCVRGRTYWRMRLVKTFIRL